MGRLLALERFFSATESQVYCSAAHHSQHRRIPPGQLPFDRCPLLRPNSRPLAHESLCCSAPPSVACVLPVRLLRRMISVTASGRENERPLHSRHPHPAPTRHDTQPGSAPVLSVTPSSARLIRACFGASLGTSRCACHCSTAVRFMHRICLALVPACLTCHLSTVGKRSHDSRLHRPVIWPDHPRLGPKHPSRGSPNQWDCGMA